MIERLIDRTIPKPCATAVEAENPMLSVRAIRTTVACRYSLKVSAVSIVVGWRADAATGQWYRRFQPIPSFNRTTVIPVF
jgi:hypothetical protein